MILSHDSREADLIKRLVESADPGQATLFSECLDDWIGEDNSVRAIDVFVEGLDFGELGFSRVDPKASRQPSYHPLFLLTLYIYGQLVERNTLEHVCRQFGRGLGWNCGTCELLDERS